MAPPTGFEPVTNGLLQWMFHFNSFSLSPRAESAALPLSSRPQTSEGTAARVYSRRQPTTPRTRLLKDEQENRSDEKAIQDEYCAQRNRDHPHRCRMVVRVPSNPYNSQGAEKQSKRNREKSKDYRDRVHAHIPGLADDLCRNPIPNLEPILP